MAWTVNDMAVAPGFEGSPATRVQFAWGWGPTSGQCFVAVFASETYNPCGSPTPTAGDFDGVILDFEILNGGPGTPYNSSNVDLSTMPLDMPVDGSGAYTILLGNAVVGGVVTLETTIGTRPMLWGTGADESPADPRVGTQIDTMWSDGTPAAGISNGIMDPNECLSYNFGVGQFCPFRLGTRSCGTARPVAAARRATPTATAAPRSRS